ncbi:MAG TPA: hypothetical protein VMS96_00500 [Terriglobales bacterium]|nr:hypothetical protein [Terriglobales bacterium]
MKAYFANGDQEIQQAFAAKAAAKSFTMTTKIAAHDDNVMETHFYVSCPDRERITLKVASLNREMIRIGQRFYLNEGTGQWHYKDVEVKDWSPCGKNPGLPSPWAMLTEGRDLVTVFASAQDKFKVQPIEEAEYKGKKYQAYAVTMNHQGVEGFKYTVLVDEQHRPAVVALGQSSLTEYSDWDKPVSIEAPANALPYPEEPGEAAPAAAPSHGKGL